MRRWLIAAALLAFAGEAQAYVRSGAGVVGHGFHRVVASAPVLVGDGVTAGLDFNFASGSFTQAGQAGTTPATLLTVTRASTKLCDDLAGNWAQVAANTLCYSNKGALVEEARTNSLTTTNLTPGPSWGLFNATVVGGQPSPDGGTNAVTLTPTLAAGRNNFQWNPALPATAALWTGSVFLKANGYNWGYLGIWSPQTTLFYSAIVDLRTGAVTQNNSAGSPVGAATVTTLYPNGWVRIQVSMTASASNSGISFGASSTATPATNAAAGEPAYAGDGVSGVLAWQPQLELGAFATSPIPTAGAAATRQGDVVKATVTPVFGAAYSLYSSGIPNSPLASGVNQTPIYINDGGANNGARLLRNATTGTAGQQIRIANVASNGIGAVWGTNAFGKAAAGFAAGAQNLAFNGGVPVATAFALPASASLTALDIGENTAGSGQWWNGYISRVALWPMTALTAGALQSITSGSGP